MQAASSLKEYRLVTAPNVSSVAISDTLGIIQGRFLIQEVGATPVIRSRLICHLTERAGFGHTTRQLTKNSQVQSFSRLI